MSEKIEMYRERDMGQVLNTTFRFIRQNFAGIFKLLAVVVFPLYIMGSTISSLGTIRSINASDGLGLPGQNDPFSQLSDMTAYAFLGMIVSMIAYVLLSCATVYSMEHYREHGKIPTPGQVFNEIANYGWYLAIAYLVLGIFSVVFLILGSMLGGLFTVIMGPIGIVMVFLILAVMLVVLCPLLLFAPIFLLEKNGIINSIGRCYSLVKNNWLRTIGIFIVLGVIMFIFILGPSAVVANYQREHALSEPGSGMTAMIITQVLGTIFSIILSIILAYSYNVHYYSLREQKEKLSLEGAIADLENQEDSDNDEGHF